jgi:hypothetical protein
MTLACNNKCCSTMGIATKETDPLEDQRQRTESMID